MKLKLNYNTIVGALRENTLLLIAQKKKKLYLLNVHLARKMSLDEKASTWELVIIDVQVWELTIIWYNG